MQCNAMQCNSMHVHIHTHTSIHIYIYMPLYICMYTDVVVWHKSTGRRAKMSPGLEAQAYDSIPVLKQAPEPSGLPEAEFGLLHAGPLLVEVLLCVP